MEAYTDDAETYTDDAETYTTSAGTCTALYNVMESRGSLWKHVEGSWKPVNLRGTDHFREPTEMVYFFPVRFAADMMSPLPVSSHRGEMSYSSTR